MILDILENLHQYQALNPGFIKAVKFLQRPGLKDLPAGKHEIDGDQVFAIVSKNPGRKKEDAQLETHDAYIDIQVVLEGIDHMGWKSRSTCMQPSTPYDPNADIRFFKDEPVAWINTEPDAFAIFFPEDAHLPSISADLLHKIIIKVAVNATT